MIVRRRKRKCKGLIRNLQTKLEISTNFEKSPILTNAGDTKKVQLMVKTEISGIALPSNNLILSKTHVLGKCFPQGLEARSLFRQDLLDIASSGNVPIKVEKFRFEICQ